MPSGPGNRDTRSSNRCRRPHPWYRCRRSVAGPLDRQRTQQQGVDDREERGVEADADRQRGDRHERESWAAKQPADGVADVGAKLFEHEHLDADGRGEVRRQRRSCDGPDRGGRPGMTDARQNLGKSGENLAATELESRGYAIVERRYRTDHGEIDIIAQGRRHDGLRRGAAEVERGVRNGGRVRHARPSNAA